MSVVPGQWSILIRTFLVVPLCLMSAAVSLCGATPAFSDTVALNEMQRALDLSYRGRYDEALGLLQNISERSSDDPASYLLHAAVQEAYMVEYDNYKWEDEFYRFLDTVRGKAKRMLDDPATEGWGRYYLGAQHSYRAIHQVYKGSPLSAINDALRARTEFKKAVAVDSTVYDAYLGLGIFDWATARIVSYIPFLSDKSDEAIGEIEKAIEGGRYSKVAAKSVLSWILILDGRYHEARTIVEELVERYPEGCYFRIALATILLDAREWKEAEQVLSELLALVADNPEARYQQALAHHGLAQVYFATSRFDEARMESDAALALRGGENVGRRLCELFDDAEKLRQRIDEKLGTERAKGAG
jgi:tetratricopeptide (TPR) repeat protein